MKQDVHIRQLIGFSWNSFFKWILLLFFLASYSISAQELVATVQAKQVKIGEQVILKLVAKVKPNSTIQFEPVDKTLIANKTSQDEKIKNSTVELELIQAFKDTTIRSQAEFSWVGYYHFIPWDTGTIVIPEQTIVINDSTLFFKKVAFNVASETIGVKNELFDIEEGFAKVPQPFDFIDFVVKYWCFFLLGLVVISVVFFFIYRKLQRKKQQTVVTLSLKERTIFALESLTKQALWQKGEVKKHCTELTHILRSYLSSRYELNLLESTTSESRALLKQTSISPNALALCMEVLALSDLVKFAKSEIEESTILSLTDKAIQLVVETSPLDLLTSNNND